MTNYHENQLDRVDNTLKFYDAHKDIINPVKVLQTGFGTLGVLYEKINEERVGGEVSTSPYKEISDATKKRAAEAAFVCCPPLLAYAKANKLTNIQSEVKSAPTAYSQVRGKLIITRLETLRKHYSEQLPAMKDYNVSQANLDMLDALIADVKKDIGMPTAVRSERKLSNQEIDEIGREINALYKEVLTPNMKAFRLGQPDMYKAWLQASRVIHTAATHLSPEEAAAKAEAQRLAKAAKAAEKEAKAAERAVLKAAKTAARQAAKIARSKSAAAPQSGSQVPSQGQAEEPNKDREAAPPPATDAPHAGDAPSSDTNGSSSPGGGFDLDDTSLG